MIMRVEAIGSVPGDLEDQTRREYRLIREFFYINNISKTIVHLQNPF
jgi:hypothetical protein